MSDGDGHTVEDATGSGRERERPAESGGERVLARLSALQRDSRRRLLATGGALVVGVVLATVHWAGLLVGGALVGLSQPTLRRALAAGLGFGVVVLGVTAVRLALAGTLEEVLATWPVVGVGVAIALVAGPVGALARGLFPDAR